MIEQFYSIEKKSFKKNNVSNIKELWDKVKEEGYKGFSIQVETSFRKSVKVENKFFATFSTPSRDRHGDIVEQNWDLKYFKKNPVYLDSHNYESIERIIGKVEKIKVEDGNLKGQIIFALDNPLGQLACKLADGGFLNTSSVGFIPKQFDEKFERILESELLEISAVAVPAQPEALYDKKYDNSKTDGEENTTIEGNNESGIEENTEGTDSDGKEEPLGEIPNDEIAEGDNSEEIQEKNSVSPKELIKNSIQREIDIKERSLEKILQAIRLVSEATKGRVSSNEDKVSINNQINQAVRQLLKMKVK